MSFFEEHVETLNEAIKEQNLHDQMCSISQILDHLDQAENRQEHIEYLLSLNFATSLNDVISTQMIILYPTMKILIYMMEDYHFRVYLFSPILKNILRVLTFIVQGEEVKGFQLELFDVIDILDILMESFMFEITGKNVKEDLRASFLCLLELATLISSQNTVKAAVKHLTSQIYIHLLGINRVFHYTRNSFEVIMKVSNVGEEFLKRFEEEYQKNASDFWLFKILQMLLKIFESFILGAAPPDERSFKVYESIFSTNMNFVLQKLMAFHLPQLELFKLFVSILNTVLWTRGFDLNFCSKMLRKFIKLQGDSIVLLLAKSSSMVSRHTIFMMKIFLTALVAHSKNLCLDKYNLLNTFLQSRIYDSLLYIKPERVVGNHKVLITLYGCSFLRDRMSDAAAARQVLENIVIILNESTCLLDDEEIWTIFRVFAFCSRCATLSELEYAGIRKITEIIIDRAYKIVMDIQKFRHDIDKYILALTKAYCNDSHFNNTMIFLYLSQEPGLTSAKVGQIIPTYNLLPLLISSDHRQVENAVKTLLSTHLTEYDLNFIITRSFDRTKAQEIKEITIGAALCLINANLTSVSIEDCRRIYEGTVAFLQSKQIAPKFTNECYMLLIRTCSNLIRSKTRQDPIDPIFQP